MAANHSLNYLKLATIGRLDNFFSVFTHRRGYQEKILRNAIKNAGILFGLQISSFGYLKRNGSRISYQGVELSIFSSRIDAAFAQHTAKRLNELTGLNFYVTLVMRNGKPACHIHDCVTSRSAKQYRELIAKFHKHRDEINALIDSAYELITEDSYAFELTSGREEPSGECRQPSYSQPRH